MLVEGHNRDLMPDELCVQDAVRFLKENTPSRLYLQLVLAARILLGMRQRSFLIGSLENL